VLLSCRSIALDNRYSTVDGYYLQLFGKAVLGFCLANVLQMLMRIRQAVDCTKTA
jgi:hypothetical protein